MTPAHPAPPFRRALLPYLAMLVAAVALILLAQQLGSALVAPARPPGLRPFGGVGHVASPQLLLRLFLALLVVIVCARGLAAAFSRLGQPPVIGEIVAGIVLGPSLLGALWPQAMQSLFPAAVTDLLNIGAQLGVVLFMFLVGLELDLAELRAHSRITLLVSHASIVVPFVHGAFLALYLYPRYATGDVPFGAFALFSGVSLSVTAFPVLARILSDRGLSHTRLGSLALACAAVDDASAWCLLALLSSLVQPGGGSAWPMFALTLGYLLVMLLLVRPLVAWLARRAAHQTQLSGDMIALVFLGLLLSAFATEWIGIHALFGAFLLGALVPHDSALAARLLASLKPFVVVLALPVFFAYSGLRTQLGLVSGAGAWLDLLLVVAVASSGKFGGTWVAARLLGLGGRDAAVLGVLMNTRGLMELIVLNVGLDLGVLTPQLFAILVLMALATTIATSPLLGLLKERRDG